MIKVNTVRTNIYKEMVHHFLLSNKEKHAIGVYIIMPHSAGNVVRHFIELESLRIRTALQNMGYTYSYTASYSCHKWSVKGEGGKVICTIFLNVCSTLERAKSNYQFYCYAVCNREVLTSEQIAITERLEENTTSFTFFS